MELHTEKIERELKRIKKNKAWLSRQCGVPRNHVKYWLDNKTLVAAERIANVLDMDPKDLIK